jgi:adenosine deaminase
MMMEMKEQAAE